LIVCQFYNDLPAWQFSTGRAFAQTIKDVNLAVKQKVFDPILRALEDYESQDLKRKLNDVKKRTEEDWV
jgi:hypothetical protein